MVKKNADFIGIIQNMCTFLWQIPFSKHQTDTGDR